jgi:hypothetical protein
MKRMSAPRFPFLHTFRAQVLLALALTGILPLGLVGLSVADRDRRALEESSARELTGLARGLAGQLDIYLDEVLSNARAIASLPSIVSMDPARQGMVLKELYHHYPRIARLGTSDRLGQFLASSDGMEESIIAQQDTLHRALTHGRQMWTLAAFGTASLHSHPRRRTSHRGRGEPCGRSGRSLRRRGQSAHRWRWSSLRSGYRWACAATSRSSGRAGTSQL